MPGATVRIGGPGVAREVIGTVLGVDEEGALLLRPLEGAPSSVERVLAGDVTVLERSTGRVPVRPSERR